MNYLREFLFNCLQILSMDIFKPFLEMDENIDSVKCEECLLDLSPVERQDSVRCKIFLLFFFFVIYLYIMNIDRLILICLIVFFRKVILYVWIASKS
jgi:hypothetical protein